MDADKFHFSRLTLGTVQLGMNYGISNTEGKPDASKSRQILETAIEWGINTIDTSPSYGNAEELIGNFLQTTNKAQEVRVVTKFRISDEHLNNPKAAEEEVFISLKRSMASLELKQAPILLLHKDPQQPIGRLMDLIPRIFSRLKKEGLVDLTGMSAYHPADVGPALENEWIEALQVPINVFDQRLLMNGDLHHLKKKNKIIFARSIFLQGLFFMSPADLRGNLVHAAGPLLALKVLADEAGMTIAELAFSFVRDMEEITSMVFGAVNQEEVKKNVALLKTPSLPKEVRDAIFRKFETVAEEIITPGLWRP